MLFHLQSLYTALARRKLIEILTMSTAGLGDVPHQDLMNIVRYNVVSHFNPLLLVKGLNAPLSPSVCPQYASRCSEEALFD